MRKSAAFCLPFKLTKLVLLNTPVSWELAFRCLATRIPACLQPYLA